MCVCVYRVTEGFVIHALGTEAARGLQWFHSGVDALLDEPSRTEQGQIKDDILDTHFNYSI